MTYSKLLIIALAAALASLSPLSANAPDHDDPALLQGKSMGSITIVQSTKIMDRY